MRYAADLYRQRSRSHAGPTTRLSRVLTPIALKLRDLRVRTDDAMLGGPVQHLDVDRCLLRRGPVLNPSPQLIKEAGGLAACATKAVAHTGELVMTVEIGSVRLQGGYLVMVLPGGPGRDDGIPL
jgi:hypothetical protein